ncbi:MAG: dihydropteroate synthase [Candidatus Eremiobacteraeota bacterium]|nr:dihydropteroate synthase [Candidatus Eremiobacteraeota bacterium]MBV9647619.1 dihydropteroate synthase [Candidatus Eremiobacteraeota bacterium]
MSSQLPRASARGGLRLRGTQLVWGARTYLLAIVNASPDSFSGDGRCDPLAAAALAKEHIHNGADLIDVGAESTRPGHTPITAEVEAARLLPAVRAIREAAPAALISVDTFKPEMFRAAHAAGGDVLNSIWGLDDALIESAVECGAPVIAMHNKRVAVYERDVVDEVLRTLERYAVAAVRGGVPAAQVILDPGIGFGKTAEHNLALLRSLDRLVALGFPTAIGTSRKSTIGKLTGRAVEERAFGTAATVALAIAAGIDIARVHDVAAMHDVVQVTDAVTRGWRPAGWSDALP